MSLAEHGKSDGFVHILIAVRFPRQFSWHSAFERAMGNLSLYGQRPSGNFHLTQLPLHLYHQARFTS